MTAADHANAIREATLHIVEGEGVLIPGADTRHADDCPGCKVIAALDALQAQAEKAVWLEDELDECDKRADRAEVYGDEIAGTLGRKAVLLEEVATERDRLRLRLSFMEASEVTLQNDNHRLRDALRQISTTPRRPSAVAIARAALAEEDSP